MAECKNCFHEKVCKYANEKVSAGITVRETVHECVDYRPTADVVEVKHGRWKGAGLGDYLCSECWEVYSGGDKFNYCPNCGAKMDGVEKDG